MSSQPPPEEEPQMQGTAFTEEQFAQFAYLYRANGTLAGDFDSTASNQYPQQSIPLEFPPEAILFSQQPADPRFLPWPPQLNYPINSNPSNWSTSDNYFYQQHQPTVEELVTILGIQNYSLDNVVNQQSPLYTQENLNQSTPLMPQEQEPDFSQTRFPPVTPQELIYQYLMQRQGSEHSNDTNPSLSPKESFDQPSSLLGSDVSVISDVSLSPGRISDLSSSSSDQELENLYVSSRGSQFPGLFYGQQPHSQNQNQGYYYITGTSQSPELVFVPSPSPSSWGSGFDSSSLEELSDNSPPLRYQEFEGYQVVDPPLAPEDNSEWEQIEAEPPSSSPSVAKKTGKKSNKDKGKAKDTSDDANTPAKRPRKPLTVEAKLKIIEIHESNTSLTPGAIGKRVNVPRTTVIDIIKQKQKLKDAIRSQPMMTSSVLQTFTMSESRFRIMEDLLVAWVRYQKREHISVPNKLISAQAFAVHRMVSGLFQSPLPPHAFSESWTRVFKQRRKLTASASINNEEDSPASMESALENLRESLRKYDVEDIYSCDATNRLHQYAPGNYGSMVEDANDFKRMTIGEWISEFDRGFNRDVVLLLSQVVFNQIKDYLPALRHVKVIPVPRQLNGLLPIRRGIAREFKAYVNLIQFQKTLKRLKTDRDVYDLAWGLVSKSLVKYCFRELVPATDPMWNINVDPRGKNSTAVLELIATVKAAHHHIKDSVVEYYCNQDNDIGPSAFLFEIVGEMQKCEDVQAYLDSIDSGTRSLDNWWRHVVIRRQSHHFPQISSWGEAVYLYGVDENDSSSSSSAE
ncbi:hypothetical protein BGX26_002072 [Mortierella sp. AD094]|nr:hypothetical protein BGX26_002072 [Mortierella sp. AD094]